MMLGLQSGVVEISAYTSEWHRLFEEEKARLLACLGASVVDIQHVGSTSIPGMVAKPILDIGVAVADFEEAVVCVAPIEYMGYLYRGEYGISRRHYFVKGNPRTHHLHMVEIASAGWRENLFFRDYLTQHLEVAMDYARLKLHLAADLKDNREAYQHEKGLFIKSVLDKMR